MSKYFVAVLVSLMFGISNAFADAAMAKAAEEAESTMATAKVTFEQFDTDGDGFISKTEAMENENISKNWTQADKDSNNKLDVSEFSAFESREMFNPADDLEEAEPGAAPTDDSPTTTAK